MTITRARQQAHHRAVTFGIDEVAAFLQQQLGASLVAYITGLRNQGQVRRWVKGDATPNARTEERLRDTFQIFVLLSDEENEHTARAWLIGRNPQLDDISPAAALRDGRTDDVFVAANAFLAGG